MKNDSQIIRKFYDKVDLAFRIGNVHCHALKFSFEETLRSFPVHSHSKNSWEIHYIPYGKGIITLSDMPYQVEPGSFFITGPHTEHSQFPSPESPMGEYCIYLKFDSRSRPLIQKENPRFLNHFFQTDCFLGTDKQNLHPLMQSIFQELEQQNIGYHTVLEALLTQLLVFSVRNMELCENAEPSTESTISDRNYLIIEEYFLYEYHDLSLEQLSRRLGLSHRQTERLLQKHYGKTFLLKKYEAKMSAALILLKENSKNITEISVLLGYSSVEHFSAAFKKYYGLSPRQWIKQQQK